MQLQIDNLAELREELFLEIDGHQCTARYSARIMMPWQTFRSSVGLARSEGDQPEVGPRGRHAEAYGVVPAPWAQETGSRATLNARGVTVMAVKLNRRAFDHAKDLISKGRFVFDERDAWSEHQPSAQDENDFIDQHGFEEYGKWYLGINDEKPEHTKGRHEFPYGDFKKAHRCGVLTAESRAGQYKHYDIENAAAHLHGMIDAKAGTPSPARSRGKVHAR
jgi:hypothetical protein